MNDLTQNITSGRIKINFTLIDSIDIPVPIKLWNESGVESRRIYLLNAIREYLYENSDSIDPEYITFSEI